MTISIKALFSLKCGDCGRSPNPDVHEVCPDSARGYSNNEFMTYQKPLVEKLADAVGFIVEGNYTTCPECHAAIDALGSTPEVDNFDNLDDGGFYADFVDGGRVTAETMPGLVLAVREHLAAKQLADVA